MANEYDLHLTAHQHDTKNNNGRPQRTHEHNAPSPVHPLFQQLWYAVCAYILTIFSSQRLSTKAVIYWEPAFRVSLLQ